MYKMPEGRERRNVRARSHSASTDFSFDFTLVPPSENEIGRSVEGGWTVQGDGQHEKRGVIELRQAILYQMAENPCAFSAREFAFLF